MSEHQLVTGDLKKFVCNGVKVGFGVVETTNPGSVKARAAGLLREIPYVKQEREFDVLFFAIVDIVNMRSDMLLAGGS
jgi:inorganic pyrophosphatase/exopolyphosphatase